MYGHEITSLIYRPLLRFLLLMVQVVLCHMMPVTVVLFNIVLTQALQIFLSTLPSILLLLESITEVPHWEIMDKLSFLFSVREMQHHH